MSVEKKKRPPQKPVSRVGNVSQIDRIVAVNEYLNRRNKGKSLLTLNIDEKLQTDVAKGVAALAAKNAKEQGELAKQSYIFERREQTSLYKVDRKAARTEVKAALKGEWIYKKPTARLKPGQLSPEAKRKVLASGGKRRDIASGPQRFPASLFERE